MKEAHFEMSDVDEHFCRAIERAGGPSSCLESLFVNRNDIRHNAAALLSHGALTYLNLSNNPLSPEGLGALGLAVSKSRSLATLHLNEVTVTLAGSSGVVDFVEALQPGIALRTLHLQSNGINSAQAERMVAPLAAAGVSELMLGKNKLIGGKGAMAFAQGIAAFDEQTLAPTSPLRRLSLMHCGLSDEAAIVLNWALALPRCPLQNLNLSHNSISAAGIAVLADSMTRNTCLERLDIGVNPGSRGAAADRLHEAMSKESVKRRRHSEFRKVALLILLQAQRSQDAMVSM